MAKDTENKEKDFESSNYYNIGNLGGVAPNTRGKKYPGQAPGYYDPLAAGGVQVTRGGTYEKPVLPMEDFGAFQRGLASTYKPPAQVEQPKWEELEFDWENVRSDEDDYFRTADIKGKDITENHIVDGKVLKGDGSKYSLEEYNALDDETKNALKIKGTQWEVKAPAGLEKRVREGIIADLEKQWNNCTEIDKRCQDVVLKHVAGITSINTGLQTLISLADADLNDINVSAKYLPGIDGTPNKDGLTFAQYARITNESPEDINYGTKENKHRETQYGIWVYDKKSKKKTFINTSAVRDNPQYGSKYYKIKYDQGGSVQQAIQKDGSMVGFKDVDTANAMYTKTTIPDDGLEIMLNGKKVKVQKDTDKYIKNEYYESTYGFHQHGAIKAFSTVNDPNFPSAWNQLMNKFKEGKTVPHFGQFYNDDPDLRYPKGHPNAGEKVPLGEDADKTTDSFRWGENTDKMASNSFLGTADLIQLKKELDFDANWSQEDVWREIKLMDNKKWENVSKQLMLKLVQDNWAEESKILNDHFGYVRGPNGRAERRNETLYKQEQGIIAMSQDDNDVIGFGSGNITGDERYYGAALQSIFGAKDGKGGWIIDPRVADGMTTIDTGLDFMTRWAKNEHGADAVVFDANGAINHIKNYWGYDKLDATVSSSSDKKSKADVDEDIKRILGSKSMYYYMIPPKNSEDLGAINAATGFGSISQSDIDALHMGKWDGKDKVIDVKKLMTAFRNDLKTKSEKDLFESAANKLGIDLYGYIEPPKK